MFRNHLKRRFEVLYLRFGVIHLVLTQNFPEKKKTKTKHFVRVRIRGQEMLFFSENCAYVLNEWSHLTYVVLKRNTCLRTVFDYRNQYDRWQISFAELEMTSNDRMVVQCPFQFLRSFEPSLSTLFTPHF